MAYDNGNRHVGRDFTPPDIEGKVTGAAKYSEDFRAEGMVFAKLLTSPMPHAKVRSIDTSKAAKMDGHSILDGNLQSLVITVRLIVPFLQILMRT